MGTTTFLGTATAGLRGSTYYNAFLSKEFLANLDPLLCFDKFATIENIPMHEGRGIEFERVESFTASAVPGDEGVTGDAIDVSYSKYQATLLQYQQHLTYSDWLKNNSFRDYMMKYTDRFKQQMTATRDLIIRGVLNAADNSLYSNGAATTTLETSITANLLLNGIRTLQVNNAAPITKYYKGLVNKEQVALSPCYILFVHPDECADLIAINNFIQARYYQQAPIHPGEVGSYHNIRVIATTQVSKAVSTNTNLSSGMLNNATYLYTYKNILLAADAYAVSELSGASSGIILKPLGSAGSDDPTNVRGSLGWKMDMASVITQQSAILLLESCASKLS